MLSKRNVVYGLTMVCLLLLGIGLIILSSGSRSKQGHVTIDNFNDCTKNATSGTEEDISTGLYKLVKSANDYNKLTTAKSYHATIRKGSCQTTSKTVTDNSTNKEEVVQTTNIVVDVPSAKQSWKIAFDWINKQAGNTNIDLGTIQPSCLKTDQLIYGDFKCDSIMSLAKYGTDKADPILQYMPYTGAGFRMEYVPDTKTVSIFFDPPPGTTDTAAFIQNTKDIIPYWFQKRNLDQSKYKIIYSDQIDSPDDNQQ